MKVRVRFIKEGVLKYIGHLDMMRYFQKAISRAKLPIAYSEGFNPHQIMSFGSPLGLGMTSSAEYMDIELNEEVSSIDGINRLNEQMVPGIKVLSFKYLPDKTKNAMAATVAAKYEVSLSDKLVNTLNESLKLDIDDFGSNIDDFMSKDSCIIIKKSKKSEKEINILPLIYDFTYDKGHFYITCSSGSNDNLKPEVIMKAFLQSLGFNDNLDRVSLSIKRLELYTKEGDNLVSLDEIGSNKM